MRTLALFLIPSLLTAQVVRVHPKTDTTVVHPKDHVRVPIVVEGNVGAVQMTLSYATTRLTFDSIKVAALDWTVTANPSTPGKVVWNAFGTTRILGPPAGSYTLANAYFTVKTPLGPTSITPTIEVVGSMQSQAVTTGFTTERIVLCVRTGPVC
jgi:hypothetical protein